MTSGAYAEHSPRWLVAVLAGFAVAMVAAQALGQEAEPALDPVEVEAPLPADPGSPLVGAGWCVVRSGGEGEAAPGCDVGLGLALLRYRCLSWVAVMGAETLGTGLAWVAHRGGEGGVTVAVAAGLVVRYGTEGIDGSEVYPALGTTVGFGGGP